MRHAMTKRVYMPSRCLFFLGSWQPEKFLIRRDIIFLASLVAAAGARYYIFDKALRERGDSAANGKKSITHWGSELFSPISAPSVFVPDALCANKSSAFAHVCACVFMCYFRIYSVSPFRDVLQVHSVPLFHRLAGSFLCSSFV